MSKAIIYGNGKSRLGFDINKKYKDIITWGCNKIHHEGRVDNLVAVDYLAQQEIYQSGYAKNNKCWFLDWNKLPKEFIDKPAFGSRHLELLKLGFLEDEIFLLGFDLSTINQPHSNVYLLEDYKLGFDSTTWQNQMKTVMRKFKDVQFTWVSPMLETENFQGIDNLKFTTSEKFEEYLSCHHYMGH